MKDSLIKKRDYIIAIIFVLIMAMLILKGYITIPCLFHKVTGLYCPTCGVTRVCRALIKGDIQTSFRNNMLVYIAVPILLILQLPSFKSNKLLKQIYNILIVFLVIVAIVFGILRNIPAFSFLAPIESTAV